MTVRMARMAGLGAALAVSAVTIAGCDPVVSPKPGGTATKAPIDVLTGAVPDEKTVPYHFAIKGGDEPMSGVLDAPDKTMKGSLSEHQSDPDFTMTLGFLVIGKKSWLTMNFRPSTLAGLPRLPKKWMSIDAGKIKDKSTPFEYDEESDPGYAMTVLENSANLKQTAPGHYGGTVDLGKTDEADIVTDARLKALGTKAAITPFTAAVDSQGRLTQVVVKIPAAGKYKASTYEVTYWGYGSTPAPAAPAADDQVAAPASVYDLLNG